MEVNGQPSYLHWGPRQLGTPSPRTSLGPAWVGLAPKLHGAHRKAWRARNLCLHPVLPGRVPRLEDPKKEGEGIGTCSLSAFIQCLPRSSQQTSRRVGRTQAGTDLQVMILKP